MLGYTTFFCNKPVNRLLGGGITAEQLNDDTLGRTLDAIFAYDSTELYSHVAATSCVLLGLKPRFAHMDSTSFHSVCGRSCALYEWTMPGSAAMVQFDVGYFETIKFGMSHVGGHTDS